MINCNRDVRLLNKIGSYIGYVYTEQQHCRYGVLAASQLRKMYLRWPLRRIVAQRCSDINSLVRRSKSSDVTPAGAPSMSKDAGGSVGTADAVPDTVAQSRKLLRRDPLVKNFFVGVVDKDLLSFPEVIDREHMENLQKDVQVLRNFFAHEIDANASRSLPPRVMENVRQLGLYGLNAPTEFGGRGYGWSESLIATEAEANCTDIAMGLLPHRAIIDVLLETATTIQKQDFLRQLANGTLVATEAIFEYNMPEYEYFNTTARFQPEVNNWILTGKKSFVVSGPLASESKQLFLVIAQTQRENMSGDEARSITIFLVDSSLPGIKIGEQHHTIGCRGVQKRQVVFDNVKVPNNCVLGAHHDGNHVANILLRSSRLRSAMVGLGIAKNLTNELTEFCVQNTLCGISVKDMEINRIHMSKILCDTYAMESMIYYTSGLLDEFDLPDVVLEAAITKYFTLTRLFGITTQCMEVLGPKSLLAGQNTELAFRNAAHLYTQDESMDTLRLFIAVTGLQYAGEVMQQEITKTRNPLFNPRFIFGRFLQKSSIESPRTKMELSEQLHPSLEAAAQCIEHSVARLQMAVELLFTRYAGGIVERHNELQRLAEISTIIYAMFASSARASRSYCIGLQYSDNEMLIASAICEAGRDKVKTLSLELFGGEFINNDNNLLRLAKQITKSKGYFPENPLQYNF